MTSFMTLLNIKVLFFINLVINIMSQQLGKEKKTQFAFNFLSLDDVEEGAKMVTIGFLTLNSIWKKLNIPFEEAYEFNKFRLIQGVKTNWSFVNFSLCSQFQMHKQKSY